MTLSDKTQIYASIVIALLLGAAVGWVGKPDPTVPTRGETIVKSAYDDVVADLVAAEADVVRLEVVLEAAEAELDKTFKVGLITDSEGLGDKSFNDIAYSGVKRAFNELGVEYDYVEPTSIAKYEDYQRDYAKSGEYGLIICIGFDQADALTVVATEYPDQNFAIVDMVVDNTNVANLTFRTNEGSFLLGVVASMKSETGKIGFVGGIEIPLIVDFMGYKAGAIWANPEIEVLTPVYVGSLGDSAKAKELTVNLIENGADMIFVSAGGNNLGALEATEEQEVIGLGVDTCMGYLNPNMFASSTKRVDEVVYQVIMDALVDKFEGGIKSGGLAEGWVGMCRLPLEEAYWEELFDFEHSEFPEDIASKVADAKIKIITGDITVPNG